MRSFYLAEDEKANISMDFLTAIAVIVIAFVFAISVLLSMITPYSGYSKELYPTADRALTLLVEDEGLYVSDTHDGTDWENFWYLGNYSDIKKIGFRTNKENNTICFEKISSIMIPHHEKNQTWWEYPTSSISYPELDNASQAMGLDRYDFYIQIRPVDEDNFNVSSANQKAIDMVGDKGDIASVVRYSMYDHQSYGLFDGTYLLGKYEPTKVVLAIEFDDFGLIRNRDGLLFSISNWTIKEGKEGVILNIAIDDSLGNPPPLDGSEFNIWKNGALVSPSTHITNIQNSSDKVDFFIPIQTFNDIIPEWDTPGKDIGIQLNIQHMDISDTGITWFNTTFKGERYPVKTTIWVW